MKAIKFMGESIVIDLFPFICSFVQSSSGAIFGSSSCFLRLNSQLIKRVILNEASSSHSITWRRRGFRCRTDVPSMSKMTIVGRGKLIAA